MLLSSKKFQWPVWLLGCLAALGVSRHESIAGAVTRGPYLQAGSYSSMVVRWRTDVPTDSRVRFGTNAADLKFVVDQPSPTTEHEVRLVGLWPGTQFFYSVGTTDGALAGGDTNHFFMTSPAPGTTKNMRIWVMGDAGTLLAGQFAVRDAYSAFANGRPTDAWLMLGDNAYYFGTDLEYQLAVFDVYTNLLRNTVTWSTLGNHDTYSTEPNGQHAYFDIFTFPTAGEAGGVASGTEHYYSFDYGRVHLVCLDSMESDRSAVGAMARWLTNDLAQTTADWIIAYWHHAPYSRGSHDSDTELELLEMRQNFVPLLEQGGVDLVLSGHSHSYERSYLLAGHYGNSSTFSNLHKVNGGDGREQGNGVYHKPRGGAMPLDGAVYAVVGSSGWTSGGTLNHPAMQVSLNQLGSMVLDITSNRLDAVFLREDGTTNDWFTISKLHDAPAAADLQAFVGADSSKALVLSGADPEQLPFNFILESAPAQGLISGFNPVSGALTYVPAHGRVGPDAFTFRTHNGYLRSRLATASLSVLPLADFNFNQLPDVWESAYQISDPAADNDGDGLANWQEYLANTNPTNAASVLRFSSATMNASRQCTLTWEAVGGTRYRVSYRDGSASGAYTDVVLPAAVEINSATPGTAAFQSFTDDFSRTSPLSGAARFYRVRTVRE